MLVLLARPSLAGETRAPEPETILRWHREGFRLLWRSKSKRKNPTSKLPAGTIPLIRRMAEENRLWGAERIRGELLKLGIRVAKRTVQRYMRVLRRRPRGGQTWATFLANHRHQVWACDFLQIYDLWFRPIFAFFSDHGSRKVVHVGVTREPNSAWVAQQMRNATPFGTGPRFIIRDRDDKFGRDFDRVARRESAREFSKHRSEGRARTRSASASSAAYGANASTTFSFSMSGTYSRCSSNTVATSKSPVLIKASVKIISASDAATIPRAPASRKGIPRPCRPPPPVGSLPTIPSGWSPTSSPSPSRSSHLRRLAGRLLPRAPRHRRYR